jgi:hypothetical protein
MKKHFGWIVALALVPVMAAGCHHDDTILEVTVNAEPALALTSIRITAYINPQRPAVREFPGDGSATVHWLLYPVGDDKDISLDIVAEGLRGDVPVVTATTHARFRRDRHLVSSLALRPDAAMADAGDDATAAKDGAAPDADAAALTVDARRDAPAPPDGSLPPDAPRDVPLPPDGPPAPRDLGPEAPDVAGCAQATPTLCGTGCVNLASDGLNCGSCGRSCEGGLCAQGVCQPLQLVARDFNVTNLAAADGYVYWTTQSAVLRTPTAGGPAELVANANEPIGLTTGSGFVFWSERGSTTPMGQVPGLYRVPSVGTATPVHLSDDVLTVIGVQGSSLVGSFDLDPLNPESLYAVVAMGLDGANRRVIAHDLKTVWALSVGATAVYLSVYGTPTSPLLQVNLATSMQKTLRDLTGPSFLVSDADAVYYFGEQLGRVPLAGGPVVEVSSDLQGHGVAPLLVDGRSLYAAAITTRCARSVIWKLRTDLTGTPAAFVQEQTCINILAQDARAIYYLSGGAIKKLVK